MNLTVSTVSVINTATNTAIDTIDVGTRPVAVAVSPDGTYALRRHQGNLCKTCTGTVSVIYTGV